MKLLLIGSNSGHAHLKNFYELIHDYFDEILVLSCDPVDFAPSKVMDFHIKNPFKISKNIRAIRKVIDDFQPSIIHVHQANSYAYLTGKAISEKTPLVLTAWGSDVLILPKRSIIHKFIVKSGIKKATIVTADSQEMCDAINGLVPYKDVVLANFGVDIDVQSTNSPIRDLVLYSNRMHEPLYRIDTVLEESSDFLKIQENAKLIIAGAGSQTDFLQQYVKDQKLESCIEFVGFISSEQNIKNYKESRFFISIPTSDGTSISLLEAMAYGCIPIVSNLNSNKEWIKDGENGIVLQDGESLNSGLQRGLQMDVTQVQQQNQSIIQQKATKEVNSNKFKRIYDRILSSDRLAK